MAEHGEIANYSRERIVQHLQTHSANIYRHTIQTPGHPQRRSTRDEVNPSQSRLLSETTGFDILDEQVVKVNGVRTIRSNESRWKEGPTPTVNEADVALTPFGFLDEKPSWETVHRAVTTTFTTSEVKWMYDRRVGCYEILDSKGGFFIYIRYDESKRYSTHFYVLANSTGTVLMSQ